MGLSLTQIEFSTSDLVKQTCKHTPNYDLCVKTLLSDPRSSHADVAGLAMVMVDVIKAKTIATLHRISELLGTTRYPKTKAALRRCVELYDNAVLKADLPSAMQALRLVFPNLQKKVLMMLLTRPTPAREPSVGHPPLPLSIGMSVTSVVWLLPLSGSCCELESFLGKTP
ncbi:Cell wall / vacuolar inhibitor of fructosidase 1 [Vitis vinifera]|uniref:Cell wall / vacuolar inhibitor of fructosidase 1 n=1 Tax=Vitis vinifera TaxID=29760 RepID=A0A438GHB5_VITVI|nr:Cell wall / vacuolar inhibitor of fructosidase 1 [Vitis vinifera]